MVKLIQKSGYIKSGGAGGYMKYIATRPRVERHGEHDGVDSLLGQMTAFWVGGSDHGVDMGMDRGRAGEYPGSGGVPC